MKEDKLHWWHSSYTFTEKIDFLKHRILHPKVSTEIEFPPSYHEISDDCDLCRCSGEETTIIFTGDLMPFGSNIPQHSTALDDFIAETDYIVFNLEGVITDESRFLALSHKRSLLLEYIKSSFSNKIIMNVANNHSSDFGKKAFIKQNELLREAGFEIVGDTAKHLTIGGNINLHAATFLSNQHPIQEIPQGVEAITSQEVDRRQAYNIFIPHWGLEMHLHPLQKQIDLAKRLVPNNCDCIIGNHAHTPHPIYLSDKQVIASSLGNFCYLNHNPNHWFGSLIKLTLCNINDKKEEKPTLCKIEVRYIMQKVRKGEIFIEIVNAPNYSKYRKETSFLNLRYLADLLK